MKISPLFLVLFSTTALASAGQAAESNDGVGPDIEVENFPKDVIEGRDPQLERAVQEALRMLKEKPIDRMMKEPPPPTWGKRKIGE